MWQGRSFFLVELINNNGIKDQESFRASENIKMFFYPSSFYLLFYFNTFSIS